MSSVPIRKRPTLSEIKYMQKHVTEETLNSTREMLRLFDQCQDAGVQTLKSLKHQGGQLKHTGNDLTEIDDDISRATTDMTQIEIVDGSTTRWICFNYCCKCCQRKRKVKYTPAPVLSEDSIETNQTETTEKNKQLEKAKMSPAANGKMIHIITNDETEREIDQNLVSVFDTVLGLKQNALKIGSEIKAHNAQLDQLNKQAEKDQIKLRAAQVQADKVLARTKETSSE